MLEFLHERNQKIVQRLILMIALRLTYSQPFNQVSNKTSNKHAHKRLTVYQLSGDIETVSLELVADDVTEVVRLFERRSIYISNAFLHFVFF